MIKFLQLFHTDFVLLGNGGERFTAGNNVGVTITHRRMRGVARHRRSSRHRGRRYLPNHCSGTRNLLFKFQDLLGKRIDLGVDLVDFFFERARFTWRWGILWWLGEPTGDREQENRAESKKFHSRNSDTAGEGWQARVDAICAAIPVRKLPERLRFA
jgi:hypothetical protein